MIEKPKLKLFIRLLIERPQNPEQLSVIASAIRQTFDYIQATSAKHRSSMRRQSCICSQASVLVRHADELYLEWRYQGAPVLARALILQLQLIELLNALLPATCQRVSLPKVLLDRACRRHRNSPKGLRAALVTRGVSDELIELALLPLDQLMQRERMPYKRLHYILQHLRMLFAFDLEGGRSERGDDFLSEKLISVNFNNLQFIDFCVSGWKRSLANMCEPCMQLRFIRMQKKNLASLETQTAFIYDSRFVPAKTALIRWLTEEQKVLKRRLVEVLK